MAGVAEGPQNKQPPAMDRRIKPGSSTAVGNSVRRHKSRQLPAAFIPPMAFIASAGVFVLL